MSNLKPFLAAALILTTGFAIPSVRAAKPDFSPLGGKYRATYNLTLGTSSVAGNVVITANVPENGSKASLQIVGYGAVAGTGNVALLGNIKLTSRRTITADNVLTALYVQLPCPPTKFSGRNGKLTYVLTSNATLGSGSITYTFRFNGKRLSIIGNGTLSGSAVSVVVQGRKQGR